MPHSSRIVYFPDLCSRFISQGSMLIPPAASMSKLFLVSVGLWKFYSESNALSFYLKRRTDRAMLLHSSFTRGGLCDVVTGKYCLIVLHLARHAPTVLLWGELERGHLLRKSSHMQEFIMQNTSIFQLQAPPTPPQSLMVASLFPKTLTWSYPNSSGYAAGVCSDKYSINSIDRKKLQ